MAKAKLALNEIRDRAFRFSKEWADAGRERAEAILFWKDFFDIFGISVRRVGIFERAVKKLNDKTGFIDLLWPGQLLVEHKSAGKDLQSAFLQATEYAAALEEHELPRIVIVSDFQHFQVYHLEDSTKDFCFALKDLSKYIAQFSWIAGYQAQSHVMAQQSPVDRKAAEKLGKLHDLLDESGFRGHPLEVLIVRLVFCLFAEDTGIFELGGFTEFIENATQEDGNDLGEKLGTLFGVLDDAEDNRQKNLDEAYQVFPHVNGRLFRETLRMPAFNRQMRKLLLAAAHLAWSDISPAIFGSLFQSIMDKDERREIGAHYTSETNILKVVSSLFLDELRSEYIKAKGNLRKLEALHQKLGTLRFLDPACGCGNFLVVAYRELRLLELDVLAAIHQLSPQVVAQMVEGYRRVTLDHFAGIEFEEYPAQIAQVAMWVVDHQMNLRLSNFVGKRVENIPLRDEANIHHGNALSVDWTSLVHLEGKVSQVYILGNPPFIGSKQLDRNQKADVARIFGQTRNAGILDYVACWYRKAVDTLEALGPEKVRCAFVSTNSITQGEQVSVLWGPLLERGIHIDFAHRTFHWSNEGRNNAAVHCVIIGFSKAGKGPFHLFDYPDIKGEPHRFEAKTINPYLIDFENILIQKRSRPLCDVPELKIGNQPIDDGNYIFTDAEKEAFLALPDNAKVRAEVEALMRPFIGSEEYLNGGRRWILHLKDVEPSTLKKFPEVLKRIASVRKFREASRRPQTVAVARTPTRFFVENFPTGSFLVVPEVSSERRAYVPMGFSNDQGHTLYSNLVKLAPDATLYHFGVLSSAMHMAWVRTVGGRLKSDFRYSSGIVYNTFPWPDSPNEKQHKAIEEAAQAVLDARAAHPGSSLADLYDPDAMPSDLAKAHGRLNKAVDAAYAPESGQKTWEGDLDRAKFLFQSYQALVSTQEATRARRATPTRRTSASLRA